MEMTTAMIILVKFEAKLKVYVIVTKYLWKTYVKN